MVLISPDHEHSYAATDAESSVYNDKLNPEVDAPLDPSEADDQGYDTPEETLQHPDTLQARDAARRVLALSGVEKQDEDLWPEQLSHVSINKKAGGRNRPYVDPTTDLEKNPPSDLEILRVMEKSERGFTLTPRERAILNRK